MRDCLLGASHEPFDALACDLARFQARHVEPIARLFHAAGVDPDEITAAQQIPAIPTDVFRFRRVAAHPESEDIFVFLTSGTTHEARGRHAFRDIRSYASSIYCGARILLPELVRDGPSPPMRFVGLVRRFSDTKDSSLGWMLMQIGGMCGESTFHFDGENLDVAGLGAAIHSAHRDAMPVLVAGTSFAFVHLLDALAGRKLPLPPMSRVMHTGGFKGRSREIEPSALRQQISELFAIPETHVVGEYGMTELSSQLYQATLAHALGAFPEPASATAYHGPPWLRATAVDPLTLAPIPRGTEGICRIVDLANVDSAVAIQTADRVVENADGSIELLGRMPGATPRGCSLLY